jgi:hypothetical protein
LRNAGGDKVTDNLFRRIFSKYNTDKVDHDLYCPAYDKEFAPIRDKVKLLFEIGVGHGGSIRGFRDYFPNAQIVGIEVNPQRNFGTDRAVVEIGNVAHPSFTIGLVKRYGEPDIVIDDGSHKSKDIKDAFELLYPHTKMCYVIEDFLTQTPTFKNGKYINDGVPATSVVLQEAEKLLLYGNGCKSIKIYHSICFFFKE